MARELVFRVQGARVSVSDGALLQGSALSALNIISSIQLSDISANVHLCEHTKTLGACCCSEDVLCLQSQCDISSFTLGREHLRLVALDFTILENVALLIADGVLRVERVNRALGDKLSLSYIAVVVGCVTGRVLAFLVSLHGFGPWDIVDLVSLFGLSQLMPVLLGPGTVNVADVHLIPDKLRRGDGAGLDLGKVVGRREWVRTYSVCCELDTFRRCTLDV